MRALLVLAIAVASVRAADAAPPPLVIIDRVLATAEAQPDLSVLTTEPVARTRSSGYGWREDPINKRARFHHGTDYRGKRGTPVLAAGAGTVIYAGRRGGYGRVVFIDHGGGVVTRYAHLSKIEVRAGDTVAAGEQIGRLGSTGRTTGAHLHFEVRLHGRSVDPNTAMLVAEIARRDPAMAKIAAFALAPEVQRLARDPDSPEPRMRPERKGRAKRPQVLW